MPGTRKNYDSYPLSHTAINELRADLNAERGNPKVWQVLWSQTGTIIPTITELVNSLPGTIIWSRAAAGSYNGSYNGSIFISGKTFLSPISAPIATTNQSLQFKVVNSQRVMVELNNWAGSFSEQIVSNFPLKIEIFD